MRRTPDPQNAIVNPYANDSSTNRFWTNARFIVSPFCAFQDVRDRRRFASQRLRMPVAYSVCYRFLFHRRGSKNLVVVIVLDFQ